MKSYKKVILVSICCILTCIQASNLYAMKTNVRAVVNGNNKFAINLYGQLMEAEGNLFFSPFSILTALGMVYAGAADTTGKEMAEALNFNIMREQLHFTFRQIIDELNDRSRLEDNELTVANALWAEKEYPFLKNYLDLVKENYRANATELDFSKSPEQSRQKINRWIEDKTNMKIKDLLPKGVINEMTRLVLTNAVYFKGTWQDEFLENMTEEKPFTLSGGKSIEVPMMKRTGKYSYAEEESFQMLELPYAGKALSMVIFLPTEKDGLKDLERRLTVEKRAGPTEDGLLIPDKLTNWMRSLRNQKVMVLMPKFKTTSSFDLKKTLKSMGIQEAFSLDADFSGMTGSKDLFISAVVHKAYVDVNEKGTEAAAATGVVMMPTSIPRKEEPVEFTADHPFLFLIRDNSAGSILFLGRVMNPTE